MKTYICVHSISYDFFFVHHYDACGSVENVLLHVHVYIVIHTIYITVDTSPEERSPTYGASETAKEVTNARKPTYLTHACKPVYTYTQFVLESEKEREIVLEE
jgi:hypothetical protein